MTYKIPTIIYIVLISTLGVGVITAARADWSAFSLSVLIFVGTLFLIRSYKNSPVPISPHFLTTAIVFLYGTLFLGEVFNAYERFWWWDMVFHTGSAVIFGMIGTMAVIMLLKADKMSASPFWVAVFAFSVAVAIGAIWEIYEFAMDQLFGLNMQKSGLVDTMYDLIVDSAGALVGAAAGYLYLSENKRTGLSGWIAHTLDNTK
jgi:hypothetical protein